MLAKVYHRKEVLLALKLEKHVGPLSYIQHHHHQKSEIICKELTVPLLLRKTDVFFFQKLCAIST